VKYLFSILAGVMVAVVSETHSQSPLTFQIPKANVLTVFAANQKPVVNISYDGKVTVYGDPDEAAKKFWKAVELYFPCKNSRSAANSTGQQK
jgi:hypothetical protein